MVVQKGAKRKKAKSQRRSQTDCVPARIHLTQGKAAKKMIDQLPLNGKVDGNFAFLESNRTKVSLSVTVQTGEEGEDSIFQVRGKLYFLSSQNSWKERGTGLLKLNVRKSDGGGARLGLSNTLSNLHFLLFLILRFE
jgi:hypothetical protein